MGVSGRIAREDLPILLVDFLEIKIWEKTRWEIFAGRAHCLVNLNSGVSRSSDMPGKGLRT